MNDRQKLNLHKLTSACLMQFSGGTENLATLVALADDTQACVRYGVRTWHVPLFCAQPLARQRLQELVDLGLAVRIPAEKSRGFVQWWPVGLHAKLREGYLDRAKDQRPGDEA